MTKRRKGATGNRPTTGFGADRFWSFIADHVKPQHDGSVDARRLSVALQSLPADQILGFGRRCAEYFAASRTWALWGAAGLIHGGAPDDTFDYFRSWLIGRGRSVFEAAMRDPDSLAAVATPEALDDEVYSAAGRAYRVVTGEEIPIAAIDPPELGRDLDFSDAVEMERRYPKLYARFRKEP